jgi:hypothetical protein
MEQVFTITYEDSTPARKKINFYNAQAELNGLAVRWLLQSSPTSGYEQLLNGDADAIMVSGREDFTTIRNKNLEVVISGQQEKRLVALFSRRIDPVYFTDKNAELFPLTIAADLEWQAQMAANFLSGALPLRGIPYKFLGIGDHHNFDERLAALSDGRIDVAVLPLADLNQSTDINTRKLKHMVLPLFECPPNIFQATTGLIIKPGSRDLVNMLHQSAGEGPVENYLTEAALLVKNGPVAYGVFREKLPFSSFTYLARPEQNRTTEIWEMDAALPAGKKLFSTTDYMKDFFRYEYLDVEKIPNKKISFIASHKSVHSETIVRQLTGTRVWAAGTKTWLELAKKGIWVEGSADGLGLEALTKTWTGGFIGIDRDSIHILTNTESAGQWITDGWSATGTYKLIPSITPEIIKGLEEAEMVFWTSYQQYQACREFVKPDLLHASPAGKTAALLKKDGIEKLVVFPSIKAFNWYRQRIYSR